MDAESALDELQRLISLAEANDSNVDVAAVTQKLRALEAELKRSQSRAPQGSVSPSPQPEHRNHYRSLERVANTIPLQQGRQVRMAPAPSLSVRRSLSNSHLHAPLSPSRSDSSAKTIDITSTSIHSSSAVGSSYSSPAMRSFADHYANDERQRLFFVVDAVSNQLQRERHWRIEMERVVEVLLHRVEDLEKDVALAREEKKAMEVELADAKRRLTVQQSASALSSIFFENAKWRVHEEMVATLIDECKSMQRLLADTTARSAVPSDLVCSRGSSLHNDGGTNQRIE